MILQDKGQNRTDIKRTVSSSMYLVYRILFTKQILGSIENQLSSSVASTYFLTLRSLKSTLSQLILLYFDRLLD